METSLSYTDRNTAYFSSDETRWINAIRKMAAEKPDEVEIIKEAAENDGCIYAKLPVSYFKLAPKRERNLTEEQRAASRERAIKMLEANKRSREERDAVEH